MADTTGVQVFVGPANQLELGTVTTGPAAVELETVSDRLQRVNFTIPAPTSEVLAAATAAQTAAEAAETGAAASAADAAASRVAAEAARPSSAEIEAIILSVVTPGTLLIDTDGRPYIA